MVHHSYITRKLAFNEGGQLIWIHKYHRGRLAAHDRGKGPVVKLAGDFYPLPLVEQALRDQTSIPREARIIC